MASSGRARRSIRLEGEAVSPDAWRQDLAYMAREMERQHRNLFHTVTRRRWNRAIRKLHDAIPRLQRHEIIVEMARIVAIVGDAHTALYLDGPEVGFRRYQLKLMLLKGELFVRAAGPEQRELLGAPVVRIGNASVDGMVAKVGRLVSAENEMRVAAWVPELVALPEVLHALGIIESVQEATFTLQAGRELVRHKVKPLTEGEMERWMDASDAATGPKPLWLRDPHNPFWFEYLPEHRTLYLQYNAVRDKPEETLASFFGRIFEFVRADPVERFVIDLRHNGGGDNRLNWPLIYGLICCERVNRKGKLFAIIGRNTFSAAMNCVNALEQHTNTLFVGEPTGTSPNHYGDAVRIELPNSGLPVFDSTLYWQDSTPYDDRRWVEPHIRVEPTREDYLSNRDPVLEAVLTYDRHADIES